MPGLYHKLLVELGIDARGVAPGLQQGQRALSGFQESVEQSGAGMSRFQTVATGAMLGVGAKVGSMAASFVMEAPLKALSALGDSITLASDKAEAAAKAGELFGDSYGIVEEASRDAATAVGMSSGAYLTAAGDLGNLITNFGVGGDKAAHMANEMVALAADLGSFNNASTEEVTLAMGAAFRGETEPIRRFGVMLDVASVSARAVEMGLINQGDALSASARLQATYSLVLDQTSKAQGDFARTSDGLANAQRIAAARTEDAWTRVGDTLAPIAAEVVPMLADAFVGIIDVGREVANIVGPALKFAFDGVKAAIDLLAPPIKFVVDAFKGFIDFIGPEVARVFEAIGAAVKFVGDIIDGIGDAVNAVFGGITAGAAEAAAEVRRQFADVLPEIPPERVDEVRHLGGAFEHLGNAIGLILPVGRDVSAEMAGLGRDMQQAGHVIEDALTIPPDWLDLSQLNEPAAEQGREVGAAAGRGFRESWLDVSQLNERAGLDFSRSIRDAFEAGKSITQSIGRGMAEASTAVVGAMDELRWILENGLTPTQQAAYVNGQDWIRDFREGMDSEIPGATEQARTAGVEALAALAGANQGQSKRAGEIVTELYASGIGENQLLGALAAQGVNRAALIAIGAEHGWNTAAVDQALTWVAGLEGQQAAAGNAGGTLNSTAQNAAGNTSGWYRSGARVADAWMDGFFRAVRAGKRTAEDVLASFGGSYRGRSAPTEGPLKEIDKWGANVAEAWWRPFVGEITNGIGAARSALSGYVGVLGASLAGPGLSLATAAPPSYTPTGPAVTRAAAGGRGDIVVHVHGNFYGNRQWVGELAREIDNHIRLTTRGGGRLVGRP